VLPLDEAAEGSLDVLLPVDVADWAFEEELFDGAEAEFLEDCD